MLEAWSGSISTNQRRYVWRVTESAGSAPAGWYDDPHMPGRMRYFDGQAWTNHFHSPDQAPDVGSWINNTFSIFAKHWPGAATIAFFFTLTGNLVAWFAFREILGDLVFRDEDIVNFSAGKAVVLVLVGVFGLVWQGFGWLSLNRFMQRAHYQANPSVSEAVTHALSRLPKYLGVTAVLVLAAFVLIAIIVAAAFVSPVLALFLVLFSIVGAVWAFVKLSFLSAAIVAAPAGTGVLRASADVSSGRFWAIAGRVIVFTIALGVAANIVSALIGDFGSAVDADALTGIFQVDGDELIIDDFRFSTLFPSTGRLLVALVVTSIVRGATTMISTSAFMRLYLDVGAPSEIE